MIIERERPKGCNEFVSPNVTTFTTVHHSTMQCPMKASGFPVVCCHIFLPNLSVLFNVPPCIRHTFSQTFSQTLLLGLFFIECQAMHNRWKSQLWRFGWKLKNQKEKHWRNPEESTEARLSIYFLFLSVSANFSCVLGNGYKVSISVFKRFKGFERFEKFGKQIVFLLTSLFMKQQMLKMEGLKLKRLKMEKLAMKR